MNFFSLNAIPIRIETLALQSESQLPPGVYAIYFLYNYDTSTIVGTNGQEFQLQNGDISV